ncbi:MAG: glycosyltransferase family 4 protein [Psychroserpens sp.]|uniref:glycosyltransferase family 4 protein n=1 Tax=Psychroserpens sp. TaxID=2020870 RepID=UPI003003545F
MKKIAIVSTHPIQYNAPWFKLLAERGKVELKVFYTWSQSKTTVKDKVFGKDIQWDIPLLDGYNHEFVENISKKPGSHSFFGIDNPELIEELKNYNPQAILFFGWNFKSHLKAMRHFHGKIPVWFRGDSTLLDETGGLKTKLRRLILTKVYKYVDKAFYVGGANKAYFLKHGLKGSQLVSAPHAIDNDRFSDDSVKKYSEEAIQWRTELGYNPKDIVIVFAGKLETKKQPDFLINAFKKILKNKSSSLKLLIVGNGPMEEDLKEDVNPNIKFVPFQNQTKMPIVYRLGDVLCLPSKGPGETWGLAVNEAMACGKAAIVSDKVGCSYDLIDYNKSGFVFKHNSLEELTDILVNLNKSLLDRMGETAQKKIKNYNFLSIVEPIEANL